MTIPPVFWEQRQLPFTLTRPSLKGEVKDHARLFPKCLPVTACPTLSVTS